MKLLQRIQEYRAFSKYQRERAKAERKAERLTDLAHYGTNLNLKFPKDRYVCDTRDLSGLVRYTCENNGFSHETAASRGPWTGIGYGNFTSYSVLKDDELIALVGLHDGDYFEHYKGLELHAPSIAGEMSISQSATQKIENPSLRTFVNALYNTWEKLENLREKEMQMEKEFRKGGSE